MWRALTLFLAFLVVAWLEYQFLPGHTYLASSSQLYLPVLQHLATPGYLSRDLVATHPNLTYTAYDEVTFFLRAAGRLSFQQALVAQQILCRLAGLLGLFLLARAAGLKPFSSLIVAALINLGAFLPGPDTWLINPEPVPRPFAIGFAFLAFGFLARAKPLISALFAGLALLYDPAIAGLFWLPVILAFCCDRHMRKLIRPMLPVFVVFVLLLANLAQLQPGAPESQLFLSRFPPQVASIEKFRTPGLWVSLWPNGLVQLYLAFFVITVWALTRIWPILNRQLRWILLSLPLLAVLSLPFSAIFQEHYRFSALLRVRPLDSLIYLIAFGWFASAVAAARALRRTARLETFAWSVVCLSVLFFGARSLPHKTDPAVQQLASWAENKTWGSSMFLFPDAGRELFPGVFRALSRRSLWVDWESGRQITYYVDLAAEWSTRWKTTMQGPLSGDHLQAMLSLPIDYFVFRRNCVVVAESEGKISALQPVFFNSAFAVYEASILRVTPGKLKLLVNGHPSSAM